jgi:hypothetical protein
MTALSESEVGMLREALDDEYRAYATYDRVIRDFGALRPFINIRDAEARHIAALISLFDRYGLPVPDNTWPDRVPRYATPAEACAAGVTAEIENGQLYERLLSSTTCPDILSVLSRLQEASQRHHLPASQRCVERGARHGRDRR